MLLKHILTYSVIRQKGESRTYVCVSGGKKCSSFRKFGVLCFLETSVLRFTLLSYYRRLSLVINTVNGKFFLGAAEMKRYLYVRCLLLYDKRSTCSKSIVKVIERLMTLICKIGGNAIPEILTIDFKQFCQSLLIHGQFLTALSWTDSAIEWIFSLLS